MAKRAADIDLTGPQPTKKRKTSTGEVRILSANTCGLNKEKWEKLETMADDNDIPVIVIQEGAPLKTVQQFVDTKEWNLLVMTEKPSNQAMVFLGQTAKQSVGVNRNYVTAVRKNSGLTVKPVPYLPNQSKLVQQHLQPNAPQTTRGGRTSKAPLNVDKLNLLGLRQPQRLSITLPGHDPVAVFNYHAPQGSGSAVGYSGMDAPKGHEILSMVVQDDPAPHKLVIGDQNAERQQMMSHYGGSCDVLSPCTKDRLSHAAATKGLKIQTIDLQGAGENFNNKGDPACSDHSGFAVSFTLPNSK